MRKRYLTKENDSSYQGKIVGNDTSAIESAIVDPKVGDVALLDNTLDETATTYGETFLYTGDTWVATKTSDNLSLVYKDALTLALEGKPIDSAKVYTDLLVANEAFIYNTTKSLQLITNSNVVSFSQRDGAVGSNPLITAILQNITSTDVVWTSEGIDLITVYGEDGITIIPTVIECDGTTLEIDNATVTATITENGIVYTNTITLSKVYVDTEQPEYLGMFSTLPTVTPDNRDLLIGDWLLWSDYEEIQTVIEGVPQVDSSGNPIMEEDETDGYKWGYIYEYTGNSWIETTDSKKVSASIYDGLQLAKNNSGRTVHVAILYANLIMATDIEVTGTVKSANYAEENNIPTAGFELDGLANIIKAFGSVFKNCDVYGSFTSDEFATQSEDPGAVYPSQTPNDTLWNESDFYNNFPVAEGEDLTDVVGTWDGQAITKATKLASEDYVRFLNDTNLPTPTTVSINNRPDSPKILTTFTVPDTYGDTVRIKLHVNLPGNWNYIQIIMVDADNIQRFNDSWTNENVNINIIVGKDWQIRIQGFSGAPLQFTRREISLVSREYVSVDKYQGTVGVKADYAMVDMLRSDSNKYHSYNYALTSSTVSPYTFDTDTFLTKRSGTAVVNSIPAQLTTFISATGTVHINGINYSIDSVKRVGNIVTFRDGNTEVQVSIFSDGTSVGAYETIYTNLITPINRSGAIRTKHIVPKDDAQYDLGQLGDTIIVTSWTDLTSDATLDDRVRASDGFIYKCKLASGSSSYSAQPIIHSDGTTSDWATYWVLDADQSGTKIRYRDGYFSRNVDIAGNLTLPLATMTDGHVVLPNKMIIMWQTYESTSDNNQAFWFPYDFPTACLSWASSGLFIGSNITITKTRFGFSFDRDNQAGNTHFYVIAIGY